MSNETEMIQPLDDEMRSQVSEMEQAIASQPDLVSAVITTHFDEIRSAAVLLAGARRIRLCGTGISGSAALVGEYILRSIGLDARAAHAYDLSVYPANFDPGDLVIVISQGGNDPYAARVLMQAAHAGLRTISIAGETGALRGAEVRIDVSPNDRHNAGVASFTAAVAVLAAAAARCEPRAPLAPAVAALSEAVRVMLRVRDLAREVAEVVTTDTSGVLIVGAGSGYGTAMAGALTARQVSRLAVEGMHIEDALQGGLHPLDAGDVLIQIAPEGPADDRHADLAVAANDIGLARWKIGGKLDGARWHTTVPSMPEVVTPILTIVPLQWLALEYALAANPDLSTSSHDADYRQVGR